MLTIRRERLGGVYNRLVFAPENVLEARAASDLSPALAASTPCTNTYCISATIMLMLNIGPFTAHGSGGTERDKQTVSARKTAHSG